MELLNQSALGLAPITADDAEAMLAETVLLRLLAGVRGAPPADKAALRALMVALAQLAAGAADNLISLDMNPVIVHPHGLSIVDARVEVVADRRGE